VECRTGGGGASIRRAGSAELEEWGSIDAQLEQVGAGVVAAGVEGEFFFGDAVEIEFGGEQLFTAADGFDRAAAGPRPARGR